MALAVLDQSEHTDFQLTGSAVTWSLEQISLVVAEARKPTPADGMRAMYARLAREYDAEPAVVDLGGGLSGDLIPF